MTKQELIKEIELKESLIMIYSERDFYRVNELVDEIRALNMQVLDLMVNETNQDELCTAFENFLDSQSA